MDALLLSVNRFIVKFSNRSLTCYLEVTYIAVSHFYSVDHPSLPFPFIPLLPFSSLSIVSLPWFSFLPPPLPPVFFPFLFLSLSLTVILHSHSLPFYCSRTDTCKTCDAYKIQTDAEKDEVTLVQSRGKLELHLRKAERAYQLQKKESTPSRSDPNIMLVTFDIQQPLPTPVLTTNIVYSKRKFWTYIWEFTTACQIQVTCFFVMRE